MFRAMNLRSTWLVVVLAFGIVSQAGQSALSAESGRCPEDNQAASTNRHCVKLSWRASVPASKAARDMVIGYNVYRSETPHDPRPTKINPRLCTEITYVDHDVKPGKTYFYVIRGVSAVAESRSSAEVRAPIPKP
jgi:hypothetical protein